MFSANRVIAVDDEPEYLNQLCKALHGLGIPCIPIKYPDDLPAEGVAWFKGIRIAFCDLQLVKGAARHEIHYAAIGSMLDRMSSGERYPLVLILWTAYPTYAKELKDYLAQRHAASLPIALLALDKADFPPGESMEKLPEAIKTELDTIPQLRALFEWEDDVARAGNACVSALLSLAAQGQGDLKDSLDELLSSLACAATGSELASIDPGASIQEALVPLLADKLSHLPNDATRNERWKTAMPGAVNRRRFQSSPSRIAAINTALNVFHAPEGQVALKASERGAVIEIECPSIFMHRFSMSREEVLRKFYLKDNATKHRWVAIQVEAACDFAQQKSPCIPYVLAIEKPADTKLIKDRPDSVWVSPIFLSETGEEVHLVANVRYTAMISPRKAKSRDALYRLRELAVNELAFCKSQHESRPGLVALLPREL